MKPKLRIDAHYDLASAITNAIETVAKQNHIYQSCLNCLNFQEQKELCSLYNQRPPAKVIAFGCESWDDKDEIPF